MKIMNEVFSGNPMGGSVESVGLSINWQDGPRREALAGDLAEPNGAFVEDVIIAAKQRLEFFQEAGNKKFACRENALAITKLDEALHWLNHRTEDRRERGVEGMCQP